ncbi:MAG: trypsin-like peptidase domain-containing protein [Dehalococcoidales bacterium]|nr:trypsin-like peptidase domain-containing protein [Dehalococcoidales bacterium]
MRKITVFIVSLLLISSLLLGSGCSIIANSISENETATTETIEEVSPPDETETETGTVTIPICEPSPALPSIADVVAEIKPSVVVINTEYTGYDFFYRPTIQEASGSGFIITKDGYIVTNNHVVEDAESITVVLDDGRNFEAEIIGTDPLSDMAVIKIEASDLPVANMGDSSILRIGDWVVAIGNSLGEGISATNGIVSAMNVSLAMSAEQTLYNLVQTNADINPGNSGGPLVNMAGEVIGITSAKVSQVGVEGMGYAISTETASPIIEQLINLGYAVHPWLGVSLYTVDDYVVSRFSLSVEEGAFLVEVVPDSPAGNAGLKAHDVITVFNGNEITSVEDLLEVLHDSDVGQEVEIVYWSGAEKITTTTTLIERPQDM